MKKLYLIYSFCLFVIVFSCSKNNESNRTECGKAIIINKTQFMSIDTIKAVYIDSFTLNGNCLSLVIGYSGCNNGHEMDLITTNEVAESLPVQVTLKIRDNDPQECEAFFIQKYTFDLSPLAMILSSEAQARLLFSQVNREVLWDIDK